MSSSGGLDGALKGGLQVCWGYMSTSLGWVPTTITKVKKVQLKHEFHKFVVYSSQVGPSIVP
jgi:hypothetical protein